MGPMGSVNDILDKFETQYSQVASLDTLFQGFYQASQEKGERLQAFAACLEGNLNQLQLRFPAKIVEQEVGKQLRQTF